MKRWEEKYGGRRGIEIYCDGKLMHESSFVF